jgi:hypothetical protein
MSQTTRHSFISFLALLAIVVFAGGCRSSKQATKSEGFFDPLKAVPQPAAPEPSKTADTQKPSRSDQLVDSLLARQREQDQHIGVLREQLQLLAAARKSDKSDFLSPAEKKPEIVSKPVLRPVPRKQKETLLQYDTDLNKKEPEGSRELQPNVVTKEIEDQYHYMIGVSNRVDSLQFFVVHSAQLLRGDLDSRVIWIYVLLGLMIAASMVMYGALTQGQRQRKDLERRVFGALSSSTSELQERIRRVESEVRSNARPAELEAPKKIRPVK